MSKERLSMRKIKEILRLKWDQKMSNRLIARNCSVSRSTVAEYIVRAKKAGLSWPLPDELDDLAIENMLFSESCYKSTKNKSFPSMDYLHQELKKKGVTLMLLWCEYKESNPDGYQYSQFCEHYRRWVKKLDVSLRQQYKAGEKLFVDYAGQTVPVIDTKSGKIIDAQIFIATLGASNYTYAEASPSQKLSSWIKSHTNAFNFFQGVSDMVIPDNLKSGVTKPCRYEPDINPTYLDMAQHYEIAVIPARSRKPQDKAKVESAVLIAERWILAALRNHTFFSMSELNKAIHQKLIEFNNRPLQKMKVSRLELFESIEKQALKPLPERNYEYAEWKKAMVNIDYHIEVDEHYYSVPYRHIKESVDVRYTASTIEVLYKNRRIASHQRSYIKGGATTVRDHMPKSHRAHLEWTPSRLIKWSEEVGPDASHVISTILESQKHPAQSHKICLGIMRLAKHYSVDRLENACSRAISIKSYSYTSISSILKTGLDKQAIDKSAKTSESVIHPNIRGKEYYKEKEHA
jgi:transposase